MTDGAHDLKDLRSAALRGLRWVVIARPLVECVLLGSMVVLARLITPAEFGHVATASLISGFGAASVTALTTALVQRPALEDEHLRTANGLALGSGVVVVGLSLLAASAIVAPVFGERTAEIVRLGAPGALIAAAGVVPFAQLQRRLAFRRLSVIDVVGSSVRACGSVALALAGMNGAAIVLGGLAALAVQTALAWAWAPPPLPRVHWRAAHDLLHNGAPNWLAAVSWIGFANCDYAIVGARLGAVQAGFYFRAYTLAVEYQKKVSSVMSSVGFPVLARTRSGEELGVLRSQMVSLSTILLFPCLALLAILAPVAVPWIFGREWQPAVAPTQVLALGGAATLVIDGIGTTLMAAGRSSAVLGFGWAHFVTYAVAAFFAAPLGLTGVAVAAAVVHTAFVVVAYCLMDRSARPSVVAHMWHDVGPAVCASAVLVAVSVPARIAMSGTHTVPIVTLAVVGLAGLAAYTAVLRTCFPAMWRMLATFAAHLLPSRLRRRRRVAAPAVEVLAVSTSARGD